MRKKIVLVFAVLLTSAVVVSLILATTRYIGFLKDPEAWRDRLAYQVLPERAEIAGVSVQVKPLWGDVEGVSSLLMSAFWLFEVSVANNGDGPVDMDFDQVTLKVDDREVKVLNTAATLRLFNEKTTGAFGTSAGRRGYQAALDELQAGESGVIRVFPGYTRHVRLYFQPHPDLPSEAVLSLRGIRWVGSGQEAPMTFRLRKEARMSGVLADGT